MSAQVNLTLSSAVGLVTDNLLAQAQCGALD